MVEQRELSEKDAPFVFLKTKSSGVHLSASVGNRSETVVVRSELPEKGVLRDSVFRRFNSWMLATVQASFKIFAKRFKSLLSDDGALFLISADVGEGPNRWKEKYHA